MNTEDREAITRLINRHGHVTDTGQFDRLQEIFSAVIVYDVSDFGGGPIIGLDAMRERARPWRHEPGGPPHHQHRLG